MARAHMLYLNRGDVPPRGALQKAVDPLGFKVTLDEAYKPFMAAAYLPCTLDGEDAGFNIRFDEVAGDLPQDLKAAIGERDTAIGVRWSGDIREELAALAVSIALAQQFGAIIHDPDRGIVPPEKLLAKARERQESL
ncbi:MAG TPA: hypothetical protein VME69_14795 [Methylocella sp.]|nr:hypothetical protein [Methylocella sp.]